jgi:hypothetical protein
MAARKQTLRTLGLESLEDRDLKAGDVTVFKSGDDLVIIGDGAANEVRIRQSLGRLVVEGLNGTEINGRDRAFKEFIGGNVRVDLNNGLDKLTVDHETPLLFNTDIKGDLQVDEVEDVKLFNVDVRGNLDVDLENVNGRLRMFDFTVEGSTNVHATNGSQDVEMSAGFFDQGVTINLAGGGNDDVILSSVNADRSINITTGSGRDEVRVDFFTRIGDDLRINTGANDDSIFIQAVIITDDLDIDVGGDDNEVVIDSIIVDDIFLDLDNGGLDVLSLDVEQADRVEIDADALDLLDIDDENINDVDVIID